VNTLVLSRGKLDLFVSSLLIKLSQVLSPVDVGEVWAEPR